MRLLEDTADGMTLDAALDHLSVDTDRPYDIVADLVRRRRIVVEFEATPRPFPFHQILVRRL